MLIPHWSYFVVLAALLLLAVITDVRTYKIPNWLTFGGLALGVAVHAVDGGVRSVATSLEGIGVAAISLVLFLLGPMGAGDVKLLLAVGSLAGPHTTVWILLFTAVAGGVLGLAHALRRRQLSHTVQNVVVGAELAAATRSVESVKAVATLSRLGRIPYAPAIAIGSIAGVLLVQMGVL